MDGFDHLFRSRQTGLDYYTRDNSDNTTTILTRDPDIEAALDYAKAAYTHNDGYSESRELRRVAIIPNIIAKKWLDEEGWWYQDPNARDKLLAKLDDSDYLYLRTAPGRVGKERRML